MLFVLIAVVAIATVSCTAHFIGNVRLSRAVKRRMFNL